MKKDRKRLMFVNPRAWIAIIAAIPSLSFTVVALTYFFSKPQPLEEWLFLVVIIIVINLPVIYFWYIRAYCFFVYDSNGIKKKGKQFIPWENVCITMYDGGQSIFREPNTACLFYLSDHYVTREEIAYGETHGGMFFIVTDKRLKKIFKYYDKQVNIICRMNRNSYLTSLVISHNLHWDKPSNTEK